MEDVDNELLGDHARKKIEGDEWIWYGLPEILVSDADVDDVWRRWRIALPVRLLRHHWGIVLMDGSQPMCGSPRMRVDTFATSFITPAWHT